jgi:hypothetical protein
MAASGLHESIALQMPSGFVEAAVKDDRKNKGRSQK